MKESSLKFTNPSITHLVFDINSEFKEKDAVSITNTFNVEVSKGKDENAAVVQLNIIVGDKDFSKDVPFYFNITIGAMFSWDDVYDDETLQTLLSKNAPALLLGYARPIIANITESSPIPAYHIPFYNFTE